MTWKNREPGEEAFFQKEKRSGTWWKRIEIVKSHSEMYRITIQSESNVISFPSDINHHRSRITEYYLPVHPFVYDKLIRKREVMVITQDDHCIHPEFRSTFSNKMTTMLFLVLSLIFPVSSFSSEGKRGISLRWTPPSHPLLLSYEHRMILSFYCYHDQDDPHHVLRLEIIKQRMRRGKDSRGCMTPTLTLTSKDDWTGWDDDVKGDEVCVVWRRGVVKNNKEWVWYILIRPDPVIPTCIISWKEGEDLCVHLKKPKQRYGYDYY